MRLMHGNNPFPYDYDMSRDGLERILPLLPAIVALAETGQMTAAAELLGIPQPTVTRAMQRAEESLGVALHEKAGRGVRLTAAGEAFAPFARAALHQVEAGMAAAAAPVRGRISVAFQNLLGEDLVPALIRAFRGDHPDVEFSLFQGSRHYCVELLRSSRADVAFLSPPPEDGDFAMVELGADELVVIVPSEHRLSRRATVRLDELADERFVLMAPGFGLRAAVQKLLENAGVRPEISFEGQDIHTLVGLVSAGLGLTIVPRRSYPAGVAALRIRGVRAERRIVMAHPRDRVLSAAVSSFHALVDARGSAIAARASAGSLPR